MTLYELTGQFLELLEMMDDPDIDEQVIIDTLEGVSGEIEVKADNYAKIIAELQSRTSAINLEIKRLQDRKKMIENNIDRMKDSLKQAMVTTGKTKFKTDLFSFSVQKNGGALPVIVTVDPDQLPAEMVVITKTPDKKAIAKYLEYNPDCDFAYFGERGESLRIK